MCNHSRDPDCKPMWFLLSHIVAQTVFFTCYGAPVAVCFCRQSIALSLLLVFLWMSTFTFLTDAQPAGEVEPFINLFSVQLVQKNKHCRLFFFYVWFVLCLHWLITSFPRCVIKKSHWLRSNTFTGQFWCLSPSIIAAMWTYGGKSISGEVTAGRAALDRTSCVYLPSLVSQIAHKD